MNKFMQKVLPVLALLVLLVNCRKKEWDEYYARPESLEPPIYKQLQSMGKFNSLLAAIDKAGYKDILSAAGYWTLFAPHDSAFQVYLSEKGFNSVSQLDSATCREIVTYSLVYNAFKKERLDDFQSTTGWVPSSAFKRRTANYTFVYNGKDTSGQDVKVVASNRNGTTTYSEGDNNNKYIPYFVDDFMQKNNLSAADYNYFYPNTPYTGFNVVDAAVVEKDLPAENGVIHVVNKVITTLPSIDQYLEGKPEYSLFKSLFDKFLVQYVYNAAITRRYQIISGNIADVYTKMFSAPNGTLAYSLNNENYLNPGNEAQRETYSIFVPTNNVLEQYINNVLLENYPPNTRIEDINRNIIYDFVNAHLWQTAVWPSKFGSTSNFLGEEARFDPSTDIVDRKVLSNGIFYGTNKVQEANVFTSVYGRAYLDPNYSMMTKLLNYELRSSVSDIGRDFTIFMISDSVINAAGFTHDASISNNIYEQYRFTPPPGSTLSAYTGATARNRLIRILNLHVVPKRILNDLSGEGAALTAGGEYIGFKNNKVFSSGDVEANQVASITGTKTSRNGRVYYIDRILNFSESTVGAHIEKLGTPSNSQYNYFWQFLKNSASLWNNTTKEITGVANGSFSTVFIPNNAAIMQAVKDGKLPGNRTTGVPTFNPTATADQAQVARFIQYHFLDRRVVAADGEEEGSIPSVLKNDLGDNTSIFVENKVGSLQLKDMENRPANVISSPTDFMGNRTMIHLIDNYLRYTF
jgi:uncharacterized surface protein with fasciclin (FAS1) repeats